MELKIDPIIMNDKLWKEDPKKPNEKPLLTEEEYKDFLQAIDDMQIKEQSIGIRILNQLDEPLAEIEGYATAGSISLNGSSAIRRSGSLTMMAQTFAPEGSSPAHIGHLYPLSDQKYSINEVTNIENLISINKRVKIEVKLANSSRFAVLKKEKEEDEKPTVRIQPAAFIFELGIFVVKNATVSHSTGGLQISMTLGDKMCLLNGECGGELQSAITHSPIGVINSDGEIVDEKVKIETLVRQFVREYAGLSDERIHIAVPTTIQNLVRWTNESPVYLTQNGVQFSLDVNQTQGSVTLNYNDIIGLQFTDFVYPGELTSQPGESVVNVLDKIKNAVGNYEYFFDVEGDFWFQEIQNFINHGSAIDDLANAIAEQYLIDSSTMKSVYQFNDGTLITAYNNAPQYTKIKNDITVWGQKSDSKLGIRYHLIIDSSDADYNTEWDITKTYSAESYIDSLGVQRAINVKSGGDIRPIDWRQAWYFAIMAKSDQDLTILEKEIKEEMPKIMNVFTGEFYLSSKPAEVSYFIDKLDTKDLKSEDMKIPIADLSVKNIGRRTKSISDNNVNCLFLPTKYDVLCVKSINEWNAIEDPSLYKGYLIIKDWEEYIGLGIAHNPAYELLRSAIHEYTSYQNSISISALPIYYLEPNTRITVKDDESDIHGDYMIQTISIPLAVSGIMNITATQALERF